MNRPSLFLAVCWTDGASCSRKVLPKIALLGLSPERRRAAQEKLVAGKPVVPLRIAVPLQRRIW